MTMGTRRPDGSLSQHLLWLEVGPITAPQVRSLHRLTSEEPTRALGSSRAARPS